MTLEELLTQQDWSLEFPERKYLSEGPDRSTQEDEMVPLSIMQMYDSWAGTILEDHGLPDNLADRARLAIHLHGRLGYGVKGVRANDWINFYNWMGRLTHKIRVLVYDGQPVAILEFLPNNGLIGPADRLHSPEEQRLMAEEILCARLSPFDGNAAVITVGPGDALDLLAGNRVDLSSYLKESDDLPDQGPISDES